MAWHTCDGSEYEMSGGGTWKGHVYPGVVFVCWALWWAFQAFRSYRISKAKRIRYESTAIWWRAICGIEPVLKVVGPPIGVLVELRLDHDKFL